MRGRALLVALVVALVGGALGQVPVCDSSSNHADIFCADGASAAVPSGGTNYFGMCKMAPATACPEGWDDQTDGEWSQCVKNFGLGSTVPACGACEVTSATIADLCCTDPEFEVAAGTAVGIVGLLQPVDGSADCPPGWEFQDLGSLKQCIRQPVGFFSAEACNCAADADCEQWDDDWDEDDEECDIETSGDRSSSPSGTTNHGAGNGWCYSSLDDHVGCAASPGDCWAMCEDEYGDGLVAIDWWGGGDCYCQHDCECMADVGDSDDGYLITRDSRVGALPHECGPDEDEDTSAPTTETAVPSATVPTPAPTASPTSEPTFHTWAPTPVPACCVEQQFDATGDVVGTSCYHGRSPWEESTMADLCTAGHSDAGAMAPPFRDCSQAAMDAGSCGGDPAVYDMRAAMRKFKFRGAFTARWR